MAIRLSLLIFNLLFFFSNLIFGISFGNQNIDIKEIEEQKISDTMSHAVNNLKHNSDGYNLLNKHLVSVRMLGMTQRFGDPTYTKYEPFANYRIYGFSGMKVYSITRQTINNVAVGSFLLPNMYEPDFDNKDINAHAKTDMVATNAKVGFFFNPIQGRYSHKIYAIIEFSFSGTAAFNRSCLTLKQAFVELTWNKGSFLFGQYFHPLFLKECFPRVINSNTGAPYEAISIAPQIRLTQLIKKIEITLTAASQALTTSWGPLVELIFKNIIFVNADNVTYIRNSMIPDLNFSAKWILDNTSYYGFSFDYLNLCPEIISSGRKTNVRAESFIGEIYAHNVFNSGEINMKAIFSQNGANQLLISGYGQSTFNPITGVVTSYSPTNALSFWIDSFYLFKNQQMQLGAFAGYTKNLGSFKQLAIEENNQPGVYTLNYLYNPGLDPSQFVSNSIDLLSYAYRISIRYVYNNTSFRCGIELGFDAAAYGTSLNKYAVPLNIKPIYSFSYEIALNYVY